jgi:hypothetical protein
MSSWLVLILNCFRSYAAIGLLLSVASHIASWFGSKGPLGDFAFVLHIGVFVVWIPAVLVQLRLTDGVNRKDQWKAMLRGCPRWMRLTVSGLFLYALVNFIIFVVIAPVKAPRGTMPPSVVHGLSGYWMVFYAVAFAVMYSAVHVQDWRERRKCANGHAIGPVARFCEQCGNSINN